MSISLEDLAECSGMDPVKLKAFLEKMRKKYPEVEEGYNRCDPRGVSLSYIMSDEDLQEYINLQEGFRLTGDRARDDAATAFMQYIIKEKYRIDFEKFPLPF